MCRLAYITKRFRGMGKWLRKMERSFGGDGNGVVVNDRCLKGVNVTVKATVDHMGHQGPVLWHTRRVSSGDKVSELCHPFPCAGGWLVHNGHWYAGDIGAAILQDLGTAGGRLSDTRLFSMIVHKLGFKQAAKRYSPNGVWLWMDKDGQLSVYKSGGSLYYCHEFCAFGSEKAKAGTWIEVKDGFYGPGDRPEEEKKYFYLPEDTCWNRKDELCAPLPTPGGPITGKIVDQKLVRTDTAQNGTIIDRRLPEYYRSMTKDGTIKKGGLE